MPSLKRDKSVIFCCSCPWRTEIVALWSILSLLCSENCHQMAYSLCAPKTCRKRDDNCAWGARDGKSIKAWRFSWSSHMQKISCACWKKTLKVFLMAFLRKMMVRGYQSVKNHLWMKPHLQLAPHGQSWGPELELIGLIMGKGIPPFENLQGIGEKEETSRAQQVTS